MKKVISVYIIFGFLLTSFAGCGKLSEVNSHDLLKNLDEVNRKLDALEKKYTASATKSEGVSPTWTELAKASAFRVLELSLSAAIGAGIISVGSRIWRRCFHTNSETYFVSLINQRIAVQQV